MGAATIQRALVVDDDEVILRGFRTSFERSNVVAYTATSSEAALELARKHKPQLAIVDLQLGADSGLELLAKLRGEHPLLTLVMVSAYGSIDVAVRAVKAGATEVFEKPITAREILGRVRGNAPDLEVETLSADRVLWEHVHRVLGDCGGNKSETARRLRRPRSWLQRFLTRAAPRA